MRYSPWRWCALALAAGLPLLALPSCGSEVTQADGGGGAAAEGGATTAGGGGAGGGCGGCRRFPEGDATCKKYVGDSLLRFVCGEMRAVSAECIYDIPGEPPCENCGDWCCPPEPWTGPTYAEQDDSPSGEAPAPGGCERQPDDDFGCRAQGKPPYAVYCPGLTLDTMPAGCFGNPWGAGSCTGPDEGYFCCPAP